MLKAIRFNDSARAIDGVPGRLRTLKALVLATHSAAGGFCNTGNRVPCAKVQRYAGKYKVIVEQYRSK